jgi:hypothetical protein
MPHRFYAYRYQGQFPEHFFADTKRTTFDCLVLGIQLNSVRNHAQGDAKENHVGTSIICDTNELKLRHEGDNNEANKHRKRHIS